MMRQQINLENWRTIHAPKEFRFNMGTTPSNTTQGTYIFIGNIWPPQDTLTSQHANKIDNHQMEHSAKGIKIYGDHTHNSKQKKNL